MYVRLVKFQAGEIKFSDHITVLCASFIIQLLCNTNIYFNINCIQWFKHDSHNKYVCIVTKLGIGPWADSFGLLQL